MTFGIPVDDFPISSEGEIRTTGHLKWMQRQKQKEDILHFTGSFDKIGLPGRYDILVGRGKPFQSHSGNICMLQLIEQHMKEYENAGRGEKTSIAKRLVKKLQMKGRFLARDNDGWWVRVSDEIAVEKVSGGFRSSRGRQKHSVDSTSLLRNGTSRSKRMKDETDTLSFETSTLPPATECFTNCCSANEVNKRNQGSIAGVSFINHDRVFPSR